MQFMSRLVMSLIFMLLCSASSADEPNTAVPTVVEPAADFSPADIAWVLTCSALVLMMTAPGLALFYGGLVHKKNVLSVMMQCVFLMGLMTLVWSIWGYSLAFGGTSPWIGNFDRLFLRGVVPTYNVTTETVTTPATGTVPTSVFMIFQGMFFVITPALICGAFAERMKFSTMCVFMVLWGSLVYCPIAHWVWSDHGWLCEWNDEAIFPALDFAGGTVVHISSGVSALVCAIMIGPRIGFGKRPMPPHNLTYTCIGAAMLWVGWFGFNAGSALSAGTGAVNAFSPCGCVSHRKTKSADSTSASTAKRATFFFETRRKPLRSDLHHDKQPANGAFCGPALGSTAKPTCLQWPFNLVITCVVP